MAQYARRSLVGAKEILIYATAISKKTLADLTWMRRTPLRRQLVFLREVRSILELLNLRGNAMQRGAWRYAAGDSFFCRNLVRNYGGVLRWPLSLAGRKFKKAGQRELPFQRKQKKVIRDSPNFEALKFVRHVESANLGGK